jgi:acyl dehydratase
VSFDISRIGRWSDEFEHHVEAERTKAYAAATNDDNPLHTAGTIAPPGFASVPSIPPLFAAIEAFVPGEARSGSVHSGQDICLFRPIVPGMTLHSRAAVVGLSPARSGTGVTLKTQTRDVAGDLVNEGYSTLFLRGVTGAPAVGETPPDHRMPAELRGAEPIVSVASAIAEDQTFRYAAASGDHSRIHLDADYARSLGLPGIIVHGLCTMAIASCAVVASACQGDSTRLRRMAVHFSRPVLPGQRITTRIFAPPGPDGRTYRFTVLNSAGKAIIQDGLAEVS